MAGAIDLFAGSNSITGTNLFKVDKDPLQEIDQGIEDVIGQKANAVGNSLWTAIQMLLDELLGIPPSWTSAPSSGGSGGTTADVGAFINNLLSSIGLSNTSGSINDPTSSNFTLDSLVSWVEGLLLPTNSVAPIVSDANTSGGVTGFIPLENLAMELIAEVVGGAQSLIDSILETVGFAAGSGTVTDVNSYFTDLLDMLANPDLTSSSFDPLTEVEDWITNLLAPTNMVAPMNSLTALLFPTNIPGLDATKITTGTFPQSMVNITSIAASLVTGVLNALNIPGLDATKIVTGIFGSTQIPDITLPMSSAVQSVVDNIYQAVHPSSTPIVMVQTASGTNPASMAFTNPVTAGNSIVVLLTGYSPAATPAYSPGMYPLVNYNGAPVVGPIPLWDQSGTGADVVNSTVGNFDAFAAGWLIPHVAAGNTVTSTIASGLQANGWVMYEVSGLGTSPAVTQKSLNHGNNTATVNSGTTPPISVTPAFIVAVSGDTSNTLATPTTGGWALNLLAGYANFGYQIATSSGGTYNWTQSGGGPGNWGASVAVITANPPVNNPLSSVVTSLENLPGINVVTSLLAGVIPGLDATKIVSGVLALLQIPSLPSTQINTSAGAFLATLIPGLDATKVTTGTFGLSFLPSVQSMIDGAYQAMFGGSSTGNTVASFKTSLLNIPGGNIISSILSSIVPGLDATKITTGTFPTSMVAGLPASLASMLTGTSPLNAQNLFNQVSSALLGMVPYSHIGSANPNLLSSSTFDTAGSIASNPGWSWNSSAGHTSPGCAQATANGTLLTLNAPSTIQVTQGQQLTISAWVNYTGLTATAGQNALRVNAAGYLGTTPGAISMVASIASPGASSGGWVQMSGSYTVPAGVDNIVIQLQVTAAASAGTVDYDDVSATKTGLMSGNWMSGISGTVAADIQSAVDQIFKASNGGSSTGNPLTSIFGSLTSIPGSSLLGLDASKIITGVLSILQIPTGSLGIGNIADIQSLSDYITNALVGATSFFDTTLPQANSSMNSIFANVVNNTQSIQAMSSTAGGASNSGTSVSIDFANYPNGPLPSIFTTTYSGSGTSTLGIANHLAGWANLVNDADRAAVVVYNAAPTSTDYQYLQGAMASPPPEETFYNTYPRIWALGRVDNPANPQNYVWARAYSNGFLSYVADIGCTVAGVDTVWVSGIQLTWTTSIALSFGVGGNPRRYQVFSGTQLVYDYTETGSASRLGAGFRYWGLKTEMKKWVTGTDGSRGGDPGSLAGCSVYDNGPQTFAGSGAAFYRAGGAVTCTSTIGTPLKFPAAFFDTAIGVTSDMSSAANAVTIGNAGWYTATIRSKITINVGTGSLSLSPVVFKNNAAHRAGTPLMQANIVGTQATTSALCGSIEFYAAAGDVIEPGYLFENVNSGSISGNFQCSGDATAVGTYWTLAMTNRSLA